jgi:hypothetical protein
MANASCARCGKTMDESRLLFSDAGKICGTCLLDLDEEEKGDNTLWAIAVTGPLLAFTALVFVVAGLIPTIGVLTNALAPFLGLVAAGFGVRAFLAAGDTERTEGGLRLLLVLCGAAAIPLGLMSTAIGLVMVGLELLRIANAPY